MSPRQLKAGRGGGRQRERERETKRGDISFADQDISLFVLLSRNPAGLGEVVSRSDGGPADVLVPEVLGPKTSTQLLSLQTLQP